MKETIDIRTVALNRAITLLDSVGAQYKIIAPDGGEFGELIAAPPRSGGRAPLEHPYGDISAYYQPLVEGMEIGDVVQVPISRFSLKAIQGGVASFAGAMWGAGSVMTQQRPDEGLVDVFRIK